MGHFPTLTDGAECIMLSLQGLKRNAPTMILKQYYLGCLAHASYLLGDEASSTAIIVDPQRDIQQYLADAEKSGPPDPPRLPHPLPRRLRRRPSGTARPLRRDHPSRLPRPGGIRLRGDEGRRYARLSRDCACKSSKLPATPSSRSRSWSSISRRTRRNPTPSSPATRCSSATSAAPTCARRSGGPPTTSAPTSTTRSTTNSCRFPTRRWSIRRTAPARSAGSSFPPTRSLRWEISGV